VHYAKKQNNVSQSGKRRPGAMQLPHNGVRFSLRTSVPAGTLTLPHKCS
jgi:hypothetical protein